MAWKNQGGNNFNLNIDNFTAQSGIWNYSNGKLYHKNLRFGTSVGLGTDKPFSRLSFGNHEALRESNINLFKNPIIALSERIDGKKATGMGFYYSNTDNYGIKFMCGDPNTLIFTESDNVKLYITNNGRFLFNKLKTDFNRDLAEVSINGSIGITGSITLGENLVNSPNIGTIRYTRGKREQEKGKLLIKVFDNIDDDDENNWYEIVTQDTKTKINIWQTKDDHLYYENSVDIGHKNTKTDNSLSVKGNVMIGDNEFVSKNILGGKNRDGVVMIKNHLNINTNPLEVDYDTDVLMQLNIRDNTLNYILGGSFSDLDGHDSLFLCKGKTGDESKLNGNYSIGFGSNLKIFKSNYSFVMGNSNVIGNSASLSVERADSNFVFGTNNFLRGVENVLFSDSSDIISKNLMVIGTSNKIYRESSISKYSLVLGSENKMYDGTVLSEKKLGKSASNIFGNLNQILTNRDKTPTAVGESFIVGDSNKINNIENNQESFIFGSNNTVSSSGYIFGDGNTNNDSKTQSKPTYIFGNFIDNSNPFNHAGYYTHNRINLKIVGPLARAVKQPPLIFVVGDANDDGTFKPNTGSMSVDAAGSIRCTNIYSNTPGAGLIRCNTIDFKNIRIDGEEASLPGTYVITHRLNIRPDTLTGKKMIPLPIKGKIISVQSTLNMPNLNYNLSNTATIDPITMDLFDKGGNKIQTITHAKNTIVYTSVNFSAALASAEKSWNDVNYNENISKYNLTSNMTREDFLYIDIIAKQTGYGSNEPEVYTTIQVVVEKRK